MMRPWYADVEEVTAYRQNPERWVANTTDPTERHRIHRRMLWLEVVLQHCQQYVEGQPKTVDNVLHVTGSGVAPKTKDQGGSPSRVQLENETGVFGVTIPFGFYNSCVQPHDRLLAAIYGQDPFVMVVRQGQVVAAFNGMSFVYYQLPKKRLTDATMRAFQSHATDLYLRESLPQIRQEPTKKSLKTA